MWKEKKLSKKEYLYDVDSKSSYQDFYKTIDRKNCYKQWSVFVFLNADNDLSPFSIMDLHEMESVGSSVSVDFVAQLDTQKDSGVKRIHIAQNFKPYVPWTKEDVLLNNKEEELLSPIAEHLPELNSGSRDVFQGFLEWAFQNYPAKHYAVVVWSHGMGWDAKVSKDFLAKPTHVEDLERIPLIPSPLMGEGESEGESERYVGGISFDESAKGEESHLRIPELRSVLSQTSAKYLDGNPIDVYGSDACLMQMGEVAFEIKKTVRYIVGSANIEGKMGWPYRLIFRRLVDAPYGGKLNHDPAEHWVREIPELYRRSYAGNVNSSQGYDDKAIMTVIYAHELKRLLPYVLFDLGNAMMQYLKEDSLEEGKRYDAIRYLIGQTFTYAGLSQDLYYFTVLLNLMIREKKGEVLTPALENLKKKIAEVQNAINRMAPFRASGNYYYTSSVYGATRGLSIWLPASNEEFKEHSERYQKSKLYRLDVSRSEEMEKPGWVAFNEYIHSKDGFQGLKILKPYQK